MHHEKNGNGSVSHTNGLRSPVTQAGGSSAPPASTGVLPGIVSLPFTEAQAQHRPEIGQPAS